MGKLRHKISNWQQYNQALVQRGSLSIWMDKQAILRWHCHAHHGRRGRGFHYSDTAILSTLLNPLRRKIEQVSGDGAYDTRECHALLKNKRIKANIPLRKNAALWEGGDPRNKAVETLKAGEWLIYNVTVLTTSQSVWTALLRGIH